MVDGGEFSWPTTNERAARQARCSDRVRFERSENSWRTTGVLTATLLNMLLIATSSLERGCLIVVFF